MLTKSIKFQSQRKKVNGLIKKELHSNLWIKNMQKLKRFIAVQLVNLHKEIQVKVVQTAQVMNE